MKKILITTVLFVILFSVPVLAGSHKTNGTCAVKGCNNSVGKSRSIYCSKHRCIWSGCTSLRMDGSYCAYHSNKNNRKSSYGSGSRKSSNGSYVRKKSSGSGKSSNGSSKQRRSSFDPDDHDIEGYYDDNRDEYDDYDDAYEGFLDDDSAWDDY